jgi:hypothetical protein
VAGLVDNTADMMTKNLGGQDFVYHTLTVCGNDEYYAYNFKTLSGDVTRWFTHLGLRGLV